MIINCKKIRLNLREQIVLFKQLGFFLKSGAALDDCLALSAVSLPKKNPKRHLLEFVRKDINSGLPFFSALERRLKSLSPSLLALIEAGEASGTLRQTLEQCGENLVKRDQSRKKVLSALTYPSCIAFLTVVLSAGMTFGIFPKIRPLLTSMHTALPFPTRVLIFISDSAAKHWLAIGCFVVGLVVIGSLALKNSTIRVFVAKNSGRIFLKIPILKTVMKDRVLSVFTGTLAILTISGSPLPVSLQRVKPTNIVYARAIGRIKSEVEAGKKISEAMAEYPELFPDTAIQLISAAEASGSLTDTLSFLSDYFQNEYEESVKRWSGLLEPALMVVMGGSVGFISLAMILPIYALSQSVSAIH